MATAILERDTSLAGRPVTKPLRRISLKRTALVGVGLAILIGSVWKGREWWSTGRFIESTDDAYVGGNVTAIAPHVSGFVAEVAVRDNQRVKAGQILVRLDRRDFQAALGHAQAAVEARLASLKGLHAQYILQQATIRQQEADLSAKAAQFSFASQDAERYRSLAQTSAGSRQDAQRSGSLEQQAHASVLATAAGLDADRQQLKVLEAQIAEAEANLAQSRSDLQTAQLNLGYTEIRAPIDGYVGNRAAQVGAYVASGAYLVSVIPASGLWVDANFKEDQLTRMARRRRSQRGRRRAARPCVPRPCRQRGTRHRRGLQRHPGRERHRQLHQDRAARAGARRARRRRRRNCACCGRACRPPRGSIRGH